MFLQVGPPGLAHEEAHLKDKKKRKGAGGARGGRGGAEGEIGGEIGGQKDGQPCYRLPASYPPRRPSPNPNTSRLKQPSGGKLGRRKKRGVARLLFFFKITHHVCNSKHFTHTCLWMHHPGEPRTLSCSSGGLDTARSTCTQLAWQNIFSPSFFFFFFFETFSVVSVLNLSSHFGWAETFKYPCSQLLVLYRLLKSDIRLFFLFQLSCSFLIDVSHTRNTQTVTCRSQLQYSLWRKQQCQICRRETVRIDSQHGWQSNPRPGTPLVCPRGLGQRVPLQLSGSPPVGVLHLSPSPRCLPPPQAIWQKCAATLSSLFST